MSWREWKKKKIKNQKPYRFQIVTNGPNQWIGNEWESSRIGDGSWLIGNSSSATVQSVASENKAKRRRWFGDGSKRRRRRRLRTRWSFDGELRQRRWGASTATQRRFDGDASKLWRRRFDGSTATLRSFDGDTSTVRRRRWEASTATLRLFDGELEWVSLFPFGFLSFFVWVSGWMFFFFWLSGWMYGAFCLGLYIVVFSDENISSLKTTSSEEFMFRHKRSRISYTFSDEFYFRH